MKDAQTAYRYAQAFIKTAQSHDLLPRVYTDLTDLAELLDQSKELRETLMNPVYTANEKDSLLRRLFENAFHALTLDFLSLICKKRRERILPDIIAAFIRLRKEITGVLHVRVFTAVPMFPDQIELLRAQIQNITGKQPLFDFVSEPTLIAGMKIQIGNRFYDGSVRHQIDRLKDELMICQQI